MMGRGAGGAKDEKRSIIPLFAENPLISFFAPPYISRLISWIPDIPENSDKDSKTIHIVEKGFQIWRGIAYVIKTNYGRYTQVIWMMSDLIFLHIKW